MPNSSSPAKIHVDEFTVAVSSLEMSYNETALSLGTCFFWSHKTKTYLVTNWHNVTGRNPLTGQHLSPTGGEPSHVKFDVWVNRNLNQRGNVLLALRADGIPLWLEHPIHRQAIDVVCVELPNDISGHVFPINERRLDSLSCRIADEVFILGYPMGVGVERLPIWKRASVASEIDFDFEGLPKFLVDTASASGMSGSPVVRRTSGGGMMDDGSMTITTGTMSKFVGVYSGRLTSGNALEAQLGLVWKAKVIEEIIDGQTRGTT